ncbi:MAG TPA: hypothetical protein VFY45_11040 [Baekduia sp.]|nr:hypothetical protein [Baekduia sp.]
MRGCRRRAWHSGPFLRLELTDDAVIVAATSSVFADDRRPHLR